LDKGVPHHRELINTIVKLYGRRFTIEETFRDTKDIRFGLGLSATHIGRTDRRDRRLFLLAIAHALITLLRAASEESKLDRTLKVSTATHRTHSLYWQGNFWYRQLAFMRDDWFERLTTAFDKIVREHEVFVQALGILRLFEGITQDQYPTIPSVVGARGRRTPSLRLRHSL